MTLFVSKTQERHRSRLVFGAVLATLLVLQPSFLRAAEEPISLEEISKTQAAKFFVEKKYQDSLHEFEKMEQQYPQSGIIKRYLASLYNALNQWEKAILKLEEAIQIKKDDLIARQMLGDIYVKQVNFEKAQEQFEMIQQQDDPKGRFGDYARKRLETIQQMTQAGASETGHRMSTQDFMKSEAAQTFAKGDFKKALESLDQLVLEYPEDPLIHRFRGITLMRLNQNKAATEALKEGTRKFPDNVAMHYYLAQVYFSLKKMEEARKEFRWVIEHDEASYRFKAQQGMFMTLGGGKPPKPWSLGVSQAYEFDTNAIYKPTDEAYRVSADQNSGRYATLFTGTYQAYHKGRWFVTPDLFYAQNIYNDFNNLNNFTPGGGLSGLCAFSLFGKPTFLNLREGGSATYLKRSLYSSANAFSASLISNLNKWFRTNLTYRWTYTNFHSDGSSAVLTNQDGHTHSASILNTVYMNDARTLYGTFGYDYEFADTRGRNYIKSMNGARAGLHFPILEKVEGDFGFVYKNSDYFKYDSAPPKRRDIIYTLTTDLSRPLFWDWMTAHLIYIFEDSRARNNAYEYFRHVIAAKLAAQF
ncbi:MAG: tetratricopeptide repeat protein [Candidatus Omnitrophica bacterium]|nr:tetratricopeptide repeat protein [Candidatus Omnitrophota bacterium]